MPNIKCKIAPPGLANTPARKLDKIPMNAAKLNTKKAGKNVLIKLSSSLCHHA